MCCRNPDNAPYLWNYILENCADKYSSRLWFRPVVHIVRCLTRFRLVPVPGARLDTRAVRLQPRGLFSLPTARPFTHIGPGQNGRLFPDDHSKYIFLNENICISINMSPKFVPKGRINNIPALVQIMAWRRLGDTPLSEPMVVGLLTNICVIRPQ